MSDTHTFTVNRSNKSIYTSTHKDRDLFKIIPDSVRENKELLQRYTSFSKYAAVVKVEEYRQKDYNRSAFYLLPLINLEIDSFEGKMINCFIDTEELSIHVVVDGEVKYPLNNEYYLYKYTVESKMEKYNDKTCLVFSLKDYEKNIEYYLSSNVLKYSEAEKARVMLSNWLGCLERREIINPETNKPEALIVVNGVFLNPKLYGTKITYALYSGDGKFNPLEKYFRDELDVNIPKGTSLMDQVIKEKEVIDYIKQ